MKIKYLLLSLLLVFFYCKKDKTNLENPNENQSDPSGLQIFPSDNPWNTDISNEPVDPNSDNLIASLGNTTHLHPDFGTDWDGQPIGIPYNLVKGNQPKISVTFDYEDESNKDPYPIPSNPLIEAGSDRHLLIVDVDNKILYELYAVEKQSNNFWNAGSGAIFDLSSNKLRPDFWTSADAAGLPIYPGLVKFDEVEKGTINHALRFTISHSRKAFVHPATHYASSSTDQNLPPMGMRVRLKKNFDISKFSLRNQVILKALKKYGMFVADNGSNWYISGSPDSRWNDDELGELKTIEGSNFEVVKMGEIFIK